VRLATFNAMGGRGLADGRVDPDRFASVVADLDVDVLALQEVDQRQPRSGGADFAALAARALGGAEFRFAATLVGTPGGTWRPAAGPDDGAGESRYGVALVSRYQVRRWRVLRLPPSPVRSPVYVPGPERSRLILLRDEPRMVLLAEVDAPFGPVTVAGTHLSFVPGWNLRQLRTVLRTLPGADPALLLGDLNVPAGLLRAWLRAARVPGRHTGWRLLARAATFPAPAPRVQLDHVLGRGGLPAVTGVSTPAVAVSDHRPLVLTLAHTETKMSS
jgi:endonuclease/exonuclease/phosphatase family metal-dependent hydrolase